MAEHHIPNRLCIERDSRFYVSAGSYIGVRLDGEDVSGRVVEFNVTMGWVRLIPQHMSGKPIGKYEMGQAVRTFGKVEPFWRLTPSRQVRRQIARIGQ